MLVWCVLIAVVAAAGAPARGADIGAAARAVHEKHAEAVVTVKMVISLRETFRGREAPSRESEREVLGTVLDETGLIVTSHAASDPATAGRRYGPGYKVESELKSARLIRKDGTEAALKVVLRDKDLDLMFLRPRKKMTLTHVGAKAKGPELGIADDIITLSRLDAVADRQPSVLIARAEAVVDKPRRFYVMNMLHSTRSLGCPTFTADGKLVGIVTLRVTKGAGGGVIPAILPIEDVLEDAKQIDPPGEDEEEDEGDAGAKDPEVKKPVKTLEEVKPAETNDKEGGKDPEVKRPVETLEEVKPAEK